MPDPATVPNPLNAELHALDQVVVTAVFAADGTVLRPNANFLRLFGYRTRELVGRPHSALVPVGEAQDIDAALWTALRRGEPQRVTGPRLRRDGEPVWVRASYTPVAGVDGAVAEVVMFAIDVTAETLRAADARGQIEAIDGSHAVVHFALDGTVTRANARFLEATGYEIDEVLGANHALFVDLAAAQETDPADFWRALVDGGPQTGTFRRRGRHGRELWLQATYAPIVDMNGRPFKVVLCATDVTAERLGRADREGQIAAIDKSHGVITFDMNGTVLDANQNFLDAVGYRLDEVEGRHHRMFVEPSYAHGPEYAAFWNQLSDGHHQAGEYRRIGKNGREVWLQASYNPIRDLAGRLLKVVKYATDVTREKLRQADHQGQIASIHKVQCVISFALDGTVLDANDNFLDATGYRLSEVRGRHHRMFVDDATAASPAYAAFWGDLARGKFHRGEFKRLRKDGGELWLQASYNAIFDTQGRPFKVVKYATDITRDRMRQLDHDGQIAAIRKSQCVVSFDLDGTVLDANDNFLLAMGYERDEVLGRHHRMFVDPAFAASEAYLGFWQTLRSGEFVSERYRRVGKGGREVWIQASYNPILDLDGRPLKVVKIAVDVSHSVLLAAQVVSARQQAEHDSTTALPNRVRLSAFMTEALARPNRRLAVFFLDLDHFKPINDTFGHAIGDQVLKTTADRLRQALAPGQMVARVGGDEFVVAAPDLSDERIDALCHRLLDVVKAPIRHGDRSLAVGLSIGVAVAPDDAMTADDLLRCADVALYRTKGNGRNGYSCFAVSMHERLSAGRHLAEEMRHGVKAGQFFLEYRPHVDVRSREPVSVEALVRWQHPERGRVEQTEFLALAERSSLILPIGEWLLRTACQTMADHAALAVVVTVSPVQWAGSDLAAVVEAVLADTGLAPARLALSLPGRVLLDDADGSRARLAALKATGARLLLDGFGAHPPSLAGLRDLGFDEVTIDRALVADVDAEDGGGRLAQDLRQLAEALDAPLFLNDERLEGEWLVLGLRTGARLRALRTGTALSADALVALLRPAPVPGAARETGRVSVTA